LALAIWLFVMVRTLVLWGPVVLVALFAFGIYLVGPLWTFASYRVDDAGVVRKTAFGTTTVAWADLGVARVDRKAHSAWITRRGRGSARFLPPLLLLWEGGEGPEFGARLERALASRLTAR